MWKQSSSNQNKEIIRQNEMQKDFILQHENG